MTRVLGVDVGIASIGFALVDHQEKKIIICGSHLFDKAEHPKDGSSLAAPRRIARLQRRRLRRKRQRRQQIVSILRSHGLSGIQELHAALGTTTPFKTPWELRAEGLHRSLGQEEFARVLLHIAKRRGFQSTRKTKSGEDEEGKIMLEAARKLREDMKAGGFETIGAYLATLDKKKNFPGSYTHTVIRDLLRDEINLLFERQQAFKNPLATEKLKTEYQETAFYQRPLQPSIDLVGYCLFEENEKRAPKAARSAELFVAWSRLANLRILNRKMQGRALTQDEKNLLLNEAHRTKTGLTFTRARKLLKTMEDEDIFNLAKYLRDKPGQGTWADIRKKAEKEPLIQFKSWARLQEAISGVNGTEWENISNNLSLLDQMAEILTFYEDENAIREKLRALELKDNVIEALLPVQFKQTIGLSLKALSGILPFMEQGDPYDAACAKAGYHHSKSENLGKDKLPPFETTRNPVVDRSLSQTRKVINAVIRKYGMPDYFYIEMGRELGKSIRARKEIEREQAKQQRFKEEMAGQAKELFGREPSGTELLKFRLWKEQDGHCIYSGNYIEPAVLRDPTATQIDHALPYSRSWDNSYSNKVLCLTSGNQNKGNNTPFEFLNASKWEEFASRVNRLPIAIAKKKKLLIRNFDEDVAKEWKERNLTDTRYIAKALKNHIEHNLRPNPGIKQIAHTRNGFITSLLRDRWGLGLKVRSESARHHALDAVILACTTNSMVKQVAEWNRMDRRLDLQEMPAPWKGFREDALAAVGNVFVTRQPVRKATGAAHKDTIKSLRTDAITGENVVVKKVNLKDLKPADLKRLVDVEITDGEPAGRNRGLYNLLKTRLDEHGGNAKKAFEEPLYMPLKEPGRKGPLIRSVRIITDDKSWVPVPGRNGVADNDTMIRVDVFKRSGKYYLIPVYVHHLGAGKLPDRVCKANMPEESWPVIDGTYRFLFSLHKNDFVLVERNNTEVIEGYYVKMNRATASITIRPHDAPDNKQDISGIGVFNLKALRKFIIDYLGNWSEIKQEKRIGLENRAIAESHEVEP